MTVAEWTLVVLKAVLTWIHARRIVQHLSCEVPDVYDFGSESNGQAAGRRPAA